MKTAKIITVTAVIATALTLGVQAFAFVPTTSNYSINVEGRQTMLAQDSNGKEVVVIGGQAYPVGDNVSLVWKIQTQIFELQREIAAKVASGETDCGAPATTASSTVQ